MENIYWILFLSLLALESFAKQQQQHRTKRPQKKEHDINIDLYNQKFKCQNFFLFSVKFNIPNIIYTIFHVYTRKITTITNMFGHTNNIQLYIDKSVFALKLHFIVWFI